MKTKKKKVIKGWIIINKNGKHTEDIFIKKTRAQLNLSFIIEEMKLDYKLVPCTIHYEA